MALSDQQIERYARHILLPEVGGAGQERLLEASVRVQGEGEAAAEALIYLAAAGVGRIHAPGPLVSRLAERVADLNPDVSLSAEAPPEPPDLTLAAPLPASDRLAGALAALSALVTLSGAGPSHEGRQALHIEGTEIAWTRPATRH